MDIHILNIIKKIIPKNELITHIKTLTTNKTIQRQLFICLQNTRGENIEQKDLNEFSTTTEP